FVGPERSLYKFQPVNVANGTRSSGMRMPGMSLPSGSACGIKAGNVELSLGGSIVTIPFFKIRTVISAFRRLMRCGYRDVWNLWERQLVSGDQRAVTDARKSAGRGFGSIGNPLVH